MPFIRLSDNYIDHPKFLVLSATAFRLWHEGMAFCRKHQTDGLIAMSELHGFRYFKPVRATELATPHRPGAAPLWEVLDGFGYKVHDYLDWNLSKDEEQSDRDAASARMRRLRAGKAPAPFAVGSAVRSGEQGGERSVDVPERRGSSLLLSEKGSGEKPELGERAQKLLERYVELFVELRRGARTRLTHNAIELQEARDLCETWDDARLEKLARVVLTTDEPFIAGSDRSFRIFALKASWADGRLTEAERRPA